MRQRALAGGALERAEVSRGLFDDERDPVRANVNPHKNESHVTLVDPPVAEASAKKNLPQMVSHLTLGGASPRCAAPVLPTAAAWFLF